MGDIIPVIFNAFIFTLLFNVTTTTAQGYQGIALNLHNVYRSNHQVDPLTASDNLNTRAIQCAQYYAARGFIDHSCPHKNGAGENLWMSSSTSSPTSQESAATLSTEMWYSEESLHNYNIDWQPASGHFSQLVWRSSSEFGFGTGHSGQVTVACALYSPPGNVIGQFRSNVFPPTNNSSTPSTPEVTLSSNQPFLLNRLMSNLNSTLTNFLTI